MADAADGVRANKAYFDAEASKYDSKHAKSLQQITEAIQRRLDFIGAEWVAEDEDDDPSSPPRALRLLDYASGTGLMSRALGPYVSQCVGIDISENMVTAYNTRAENQGLTRNEMYAYQGDLTADDDPDPAGLSGPEFFDFDVAAVGGGFHHFSNPSLAARRLVARLRPGGVLLIWDFLPHEADQHSASHTVTHHGFSEDQIRGIFTEAGASTGFALEDLGSGLIVSTGAGEKVLKRRVFLARGQKAGNYRGTSR